LERKKEKEKQKRAMTKKVVGFSNPLSGCKLPKSTNSEYASSKNISWKRTGKPSLDGSVALHATEPFPKKAPNGAEKEEVESERRRGKFA